MSKRDELKAAIINQALLIAAFEGWNDATLTKAAVAIGEHPMSAKRLFPRGAYDALEFFNETINAQLIELAAQKNLAQMRTHERIKWLMMQRFLLLEPNKEAIKRAIAFMLLPSNSSGALEQLWHNCDVIWRLAGDKSLDFNYYSKRGLLAKVYTSTTIIWLNDETENCSQTHEFMQKQIAQILNMGKNIGMTKAKIGAFIENTTDKMLNQKRYRTKKY